MSYWTNLNPKLLEYRSRIEVVDKLYYNKYLGRVRFWPMYKFRSFWSRKHLWQSSMFDLCKDFSHFELDTLHIDFKRIQKQEVSRSSTWKKNAKHLKASYKALQFLMRNNLTNIRMEGGTVDVYWSNLDWLNNIREDGLTDSVWKISLCDPITKPDEELVDSLPLDKYRYRVILKEQKRIETNKVNALLDLDSSGDISITDRRKINWKQYNMYYKDWFYVQDDITLTTVNLILGSDVHRVIEYKRREQ